MQAAGSSSTGLSGSTRLGVKVCKGLWEGKLDCRATSGSIGFRREGFRLGSRDGLETLVEGRVNSREGSEALPEKIGEGLGGGTSSKEGSEEGGAGSDPKRSQRWFQTRVQMSGREPDQ